MGTPSPLHVASARRLFLLALTLATVATSITCSSPTDAPAPPGNSEPPPPPPPPPPPSLWDGSLQLGGPDTLIVHQSELLTLTANDA
jgi:hypothetical protein